MNPLCQCGCGREVSKHGRMYATRECANKSLKSRMTPAKANIGKPGRKAGKKPIALPRGTHAEICTTIGDKVAEKYGEGWMAKKNRARGKRSGKDKARLAMSLFATAHTLRCRPSEATSAHPQTSPGH